MAVERKPMITMVGNTSVTVGEWIYDCSDGTNEPSLNFGFADITTLTMGDNFQDIADAVIAAIEFGLNALGVDPEIIEEAGKFLDVVKKLVPSGTTFQLIYGIGVETKNPPCDPDAESGPVRFARYEAFAFIRIKFDGNLGQVGVKKDTQANWVFARDFVSCDCPKDEDALSLASDERVRVAVFPVGGIGLEPVAFEASSPEESPSEAEPGGKPAKQLAKRASKRKSESKA